LSTSAVSTLDSLRLALAAQRSMRADRVAVSQLLARLERMSAGASIEQTATAIAKALVTLPGIQVGGVLERVGNGLHVLGLVAPTGYPLKPGVLIPEAHAATLIAKSQAGPWAISTAGIPDGDRENIDSIDLRATAWAPLWSGDEMIGLIGIGTSDEAMTAHLVTDLPAIGEVAATVSALLGPELSARRTTSASKHEIRQLIADRAFWPVFQSIVSTPDRQVVGYEALTRFRDLAPPDQRFREAARLGLDVELELATLEAALRAAQRLVPSDAWLSLNVSPALVAQRTRLARVLRRSTHPLVLELTEHMPIADYGRLRSHLAALDVPFRIAVDDAGAGYASMQHIVELRPSLIKLDISLVRGVDADPVRQALVAGMRYFADRVECGLLAEGVETEAELATLSTLGVPLAQGFLFGRPVAVEEIAAPVCGAGLGQPRTPPTLNAPNRPKGPLFKGLAWAGPPAGATCAKGRKTRRQADLGSSRTQIRSGVSEPAVAYDRSDHSGCPADNVLGS
jgi:EAL domain-containing protein (putative c-di-GMP-specific phosphodiesterase class I)